MFCRFFANGFLMKTVSTYQLLHGMLELLGELHSFDEVQRANSN